MATAVAIESWEDDGDIEGALGHFSARNSSYSMSNAAEDEWANDAAIPIPANVPASALVGGSIQRLGKKPSQKTAFDDWGDDLGVPHTTDGTLTIKPKRPEPIASHDGQDEFDDWTEGSLGIRFAGTRRDTRNRGSSISAISPSLGSVKTFESEEDGLDGLVIPSGLNFDSTTIKQQPQPEARQSIVTTTMKPKPPPKTPTNIRDSQKDDFFSDIEFGAGEVFDPNKRTLNRNIKQKQPATVSRTQQAEKPVITKIPRLVSASKPTRLDPVFESAPTNTGSPQMGRMRRPEPTTTHAQLLRSKRSMPALRNQNLSTGRQPPLPYSPQSNMASQPQRLTTKSSNSNLRRDSDPNRPLSPPVRSHSRLSAAHVPDTPTRPRRDVAPAALVREAANKRTITRPTRRRNFGDGNELEIFADLPVSAAKESKFLKQPSTRPAPKALRNQPSLTKFPLREKTMTPLPTSVPKSPTKTENLPRFARDTAASRNAREQKLGNVRSIREGPLQPVRSINWQAQVAARTPHSSPTAQKSQRKGPTLIHPMNHGDRPRTEKDMTWNPTLCRWEGNENILAAFDAPAVLEPAAPPSPPRPALITNINSTQGVQVVGGMVFDPRRMCWLKIGATPSNPMSPSIEDEDDPFKGIDDLQDKTTTENNSTTGTRGASVGGDWLVGEEFDLGPEFIKRQRDEETVWRNRIGAWFGWEKDKEAYKWAIRDIAA